MPNEVNSHPQRSDVNNGINCTYLTTTWILVQQLWQCLLPEFVLVHNGIITNYKDIKKFVVWVKIILSWAIYKPSVTNVLITVAGGTWLCVRVWHRHWSHSKVDEISVWQSGQWCCQPSYPHTIVSGYDARAIHKHAYNYISTQFRDCTVHWNCNLEIAQLILRLLMALAQSWDCISANVWFWTWTMTLQYAITIQTGCDVLDT